MDYGLIHRLETTTAEIHDSQIDLSEPGEVVYRDRGYFGAPYRGYNATMDRNVRGHPITEKQKTATKEYHAKEHQENAHTP